MGFINDFKQAVNELLPDFGEEPGTEESAEEEYTDPKDSLKSAEKELDELEEELEDIDPLQTVIDEQTTIKGNIESSGDMVLNCSIEGPVTCIGELKVGGNIIGDVIAGELIMNHSHIEGNVDVNGEANIAEFAVIKGNLRASEAYVAGTIHGSLDIRGKVILAGTASVFGDIKAQELVKLEGARLEGNFTESYMEFTKKKSRKDGK